MTGSPAGNGPIRIDIVVNNYNYAGFLSAAIDSALAQSYPHVRVIVVDDGSTDNSAEIIAAYGDRIVAINKANGGQASTFNAGFAVASADALMFLDADDVLHPDIAAHVAQAMAAQPELVKVQWRMEVAEADGRPTGVVLPTEHLPLPNGDMRRAELHFPFDITWMATSGNAFRTEMLREIMPMPEAEYRLHADSYLQHLPPLLGPVCSLEFVGALRRVHGANSFEQSPTAELDLDHVRGAITAAQETRRHLEALADRLGLDRPRGPILSVSDTVNRLISLRMEPSRHPISADTRFTLVRDGIRAAARRFDVRPPMRVLFGCWFVATASAPVPVARQLSQWISFPERRAGFNRRVLRVLHRGSRA